MIVSEGLYYVGLGKLDGQLLDGHTREFVSFVSSVDNAFVL